MTIETAVGRIPEWTVGDRLRKARETTGLDQSAFAEQIGISRKTVGRYESDAAKPSRAMYLLWQMRTGVAVQWLETGQAPVEPGPGESRLWESNPRPSHYKGAGSRPVVSITSRKLVDAA